MLGKIWHWVQHFAACATTVFVLKYMSVWQILNLASTSGYLAVCITWSKLMILSWRRWGSQGRKGRHLPPGEAFWGRKLRLECHVRITKCQISADASNYDLQNVWCQSLTPSCKIWSRSPRFAKGTITNLSDILRRRCVYSNQRTHMVWLMVASQCFQIAKLANFSTSLSFYSCVTMDGNSVFTVHATAHAFRAAINLNSMLLQQHIWCLGNYLIFDGLTNFMLKQIWCGSEGNYEDFL